MLSLLIKTKFIVEINGDVSADRNLTKKNKIFTKLLSFLQYLSLKYATSIIVPTYRLKKNLASIYNIPESKICYAENAIDLDSLKSNSSSYKNSNIIQEKFTVGYAGTFSIWQGIPLIIDALNYLDSDILKNIQFVLVGDGPEYNSIQELINNSDYSEYFVLTGRLSQGDYMSAINYFDVCLAPYIKERNDFWGVSPIKIHSYMACSKAIISSNISGARSLINNSGCGYLFEPDSSISLAKAITQAFHERNLLPDMGLKGFNYVSRTNTWSHTASKILEF